MVGLGEGCMYQTGSVCAVFGCCGRSVDEDHSTHPRTTASALMADRLWTPALLIIATPPSLLHTQLIAWIPQTWFKTSTIALLHS